MPRSRKTISSQDVRVQLSKLKKRVARVERLLQEHDGGREIDQDFLRDIHASVKYAVIWANELK